MKQHQVDYEKIFECLKELANNFSEAEVTHHHTTAQVLLDLCRGERKWEFLTQEERKNLTKNRHIQDLREPKKYLKAVLTKKLISYIRKGKITFAHSFNFEKMTDGMFEMEYDEFERCHVRPRIPTPLEGL